MSNFGIGSGKSQNNNCDSSGLDVDGGTYDDFLESGGPWVDVVSLLFLFFVIENFEKFKI